MFSVRISYCKTGFAVILVAAILLLMFASPAHTSVAMASTSGGIAVPASTSTSNNTSHPQQNVSMLQFFEQFFEIFISGIVGIFQAFMSNFSGSISTTFEDLAMMYASDFYPYGVYGPLIFILSVGVGAMGTYGVLSLGKPVEDLE